MSKTNTLVATLTKDVSKKTGNEYWYVDLAKKCQSNDEFSFDKRIFLDENDVKVLRMIDLLDATK